ncbi:hypothetical protein PIB30_106298 [Stylosanthes scabra]|uniref:Uncharacterized protein n=1 Tax=Stylosanthes scabra TaxID=79078 RepID=A0ABU6XYA4_9FABA|nr:hypothetical protein [Stylosanthes scabra]
MDGANEEDVLEHDMDSDVGDVANALANEFPFQEASFMRVLDEEAMKEPEFAEDMNPGHIFVQRDAYWWGIIPMPGRNSVKPLTDPVSVLVPPILALRTRQTFVVLGT